MSDDQVQKQNAQDGAADSNAAPSDVQTVPEEVIIEEPKIETTADSKQLTDEKTEAPKDKVLSYDALPSEELAKVELSKKKKELSKEQKAKDEEKVDLEDSTGDVADNEPAANDNPNAKWYVVHTYSGHENKVSQALRQRIESEHLEHKIIDVLVPTQDKIEIKAGKKESVKEKIFPGYILVKMVLDDGSWLAVRTTQGVTSFVGIGNKPTPIPEHEVKTIVRFMSQGATSTFKDVYQINDTIKIVDGPFSDFIGKVDTVDKEKGKVRVLVSIFGRETPVELDFLQVQKL